VVSDVAVYHDAVVLRHDTGPYHPETAGRVEACVTKLRGAGLPIECPESPERTLSAIGRTHTPSYIDRLRQVCNLAPPGHEEAFTLFDSPDNPISGATFGASTRAVGLALAAADAVLAGKTRSAFVAARPPGHHALASNAMGFCFFNTIAIVARDLIESAGLSRVLIADFDVHHGNGTQDIFWRDGQVAYLSVHRFPFYPGSGTADETGEGRGLGVTLNLPLHEGAGDDVYAGAFEAGLERLAEKFRPEFVLVSAGFDAHVRDPLGGMRVSTEGYGRMTRALRDVAGTFANGRIVSLLEGGYDPRALGEAALEHVSMLSTHPTPASL
jgi:acetoin utilization deacetylase AcuC-like enzyme